MATKTAFVLSPENRAAVSKAACKEYADKVSRDMVIKSSITDLKVKAGSVQADAIKKIVYSALTAIVAGESVQTVAKTAAIMVEQFFPYLDGYYTVYFPIWLWEDSIEPGARLYI